MDEREKRQVKKDGVVLLRMIPCVCVCVGPNQSI